MTIPQEIIACILSHRPHLRFLVERGSYRDLASNYLRGELAKKYKFDDVTVFYEAICKAARGYDESKGYTFRALLTRACHNAAIDMWRKKADPLVVGCKPEQLEVSEVQPIVNTSWTPPPDVPERKIRAPGMSVRSIQRRAKEQGWAAKPGRPRVLDDATVLKLLLAGKSQADAQRALGVCVRTVRDRCAKTRQTLKVLARTPNRSSILAASSRHDAPSLRMARAAAICSGTPRLVRWAWLHRGWDSRHADYF